MGIFGRIPSDDDFPEVNAINRQKFLAELAKLLTFMYEEDRQYAMSMYERMFDIAEGDEQWLIQNLMSPTRQAVVIARAYDAKERKLSVSTQSKEEDDVEEEEGTPRFVLAINKIFDDLFPEETEVPEPTEDQFSLFELGEMEEETEQQKPKMPKAATLLSTTQEFKLNLDEQVNPEEEDEGEPEAGEEPEITETLPPEETDTDDLFSDPVSEIKKMLSEISPEEPKKATPDEPTAELPGEDEALQEETPEFSPEMQTEGGSDLDVQTEKNAAETEPAENLNEENTEERAEEAETGAVADETEPTESEPAEEQEAEPSFEPDESAESEKEAEAVLPEPQPEEALTPSPEKEEKTADEALPEERTPVIPPVERKKKVREVEPTERTVNIPLLILFLIVAIPVTAALLVLLLIPALASLVAAVGLCALGAVLVAAAFSGFAVLADILLLLGAALVMLALGLLLLWFAIWLIGDVMCGLIGSVRELAEKWCNREVPAE